MTIPAIDKERRRALFKLGLGFLVSLVIPCVVATYLGRDKAFQIVLVMSVLLGWIIFGPPMFMTSQNAASEKEWVDGGRSYARWIFRLGTPAMLAINLFMVGTMTARLDSPAGTPAFNKRSGEYMIVVHDDRLEVLTNEWRFNFTDRQLATIPASMPLDGLAGSAEGSKLLRELHGLVGNRQTFADSGPPSQSECPVGIL